MSEVKTLETVIIARSDGADTGPGYWPIATTPAAKKPTTTTKEVPEKAPRAKPQMIRLNDDDPRFIEWKVKLGMLLKQELAPEPDEGNAWFVQFPRGYWLYEKSKHLWVSGYPVKSKLFKSPQEFALHLLWLLSSSKDYKDCSCVHCNAHNVTKITLEDTPTMAIAELAPKSQVKETPVPLPAMPGQPAQKPQPPPQPQPRAVTPATAQSTPPAAAWSLRSSLLFRPGELVWYQTGHTWRIGIIASCTQSGNEIMPLGFAMVPQPNVVKQMIEIRPFLTFMVPDLSFQELKGKKFDDVRWDSLLQACSADPARREAAVLDASKLAASRIANTYSLWSLLSGDPTSKSTTYYGCFLGAERVEIGDCLRVKQLPPEYNIAGDGLALGVRYIFTMQDYPGAVFFRGPLYRPADPALASTSLVPDEALPVALRDESNWRNHVNSSPRRGWVMVQENMVLKEALLAGRFYPAHRILPILDPASLQRAMELRQVDGVHVFLNSRLEQPQEYVGRQRNRKQSMGLAVVQGISLSLEPHIREEPDN